MGADIHGAVERQKAGRWTFAQKLDLDRNYVLFGILAGVRYGDVQPIASPRGLPADRDRSADYYEGDHSYSYLTLAELRAFDWDQPLVHGGCIPLRDVDRHFPGYPETYAQWRTSPPHRPVEGCRGLSGAQILDLRPRALFLSQLSSPDRATRNTTMRKLESIDADHRTAERLLADPSLMPEPEEPPSGALIRQPGQRYGWLPGKNNPRTAWAYVAWTETARETCAPFCAWLDEQKDVPGDELRLVFGFDS